MQSWAKRGNCFHSLWITLFNWVGGVPFKQTCSVVESEFLHSLLWAWIIGVTMVVIEYTHQNWSASGSHIKILCFLGYDEEMCSLLSMLGTTFLLLTKYYNKILHLDLSCSFCLCFLRRIFKLSTLLKVELFTAEAVGSAKSETFCGTFLKVSRPFTLLQSSILCSFYLFL